MPRKGQPVRRRMVRVSSLVPLARAWSRLSRMERVPNDVRETLKAARRDLMLTVRRDCPNVERLRKVVSDAN